LASKIDAMRNAAHEGRHGSRDDAVVTLLYDTGLRRGELSAVDRLTLDLNTGELRIPPHIQKDYPNENTPDPVTFELDRASDLRTVRTLPAYLSARDDDSPALFLSRKAERMTGRGINDLMQRLADWAGVEPHVHTDRGDLGDVSAHTLRHSVVWRMLQAETDNTLYDVRNWLRHASILTIERQYGHFDTA
jgi:integrase